MKSKIKKINKNKLYLVPAGILAALLALATGTKYASQIKTILNQPTVNQGEVKVLPKNGTVQRVIDGDTVILKDGTIIRYQGINTPEHNDPFYSESINANKKFVEGKKVKLEYDAYTSDKFGRVLAYVVVDDTNVSIELVRHGLAKVVILQDRRKLIYQDQLLNVQEEAKQLKIGIWSVK